ncbi:MAG: RNA polymerase factor sigma-54 [Pseudomonadota bacterium]
MMLSQTISQKQTMQMGGQMLHSISILGMSTPDLSEHLKEQAAANPYLRYRPPAGLAAAAGGDFDAVAAVAADRPSLMAHVVEQIEIAFPDATDRLIALHFAEALEPTGWLGQPLEAVALTAGVPPTRAARVLDSLQEFEPTGLFARSLSECLTLQAREQDLLTWEVEMLLANLDLVAEGKIAELADLCDCEVSDIPDILAQIKGLDPKPGQAFDHVRQPVFPPDLIARHGPKGWEVELNRATSPTVTVLDERKEDGSIDAEARALRAKALSEARQLAQALARRNDTLLRTAAILVARQARFMNEGAASLAPLTRDDVAAELGVHASTVSRAVAGRMIQTPTHALPLKAFFSRAVSGAVSRDCALDFVRTTIGDENPEDPLSDDAVVALARRSGLRIARRTVAKYRAALGIASSYTRRRKALAI